MRRGLSLLIVVLAGSALCGATLTARANLILNGSFETLLIATATYFEIPMGSEPSGFDWTVITNMVDIISNGWLSTSDVAVDGVQALDLVGVGSTGGIEQTFVTTPDTEYSLTFAYANNPLAQATASASVTIADGPNTLFAGSVTHNTATLANFDWMPYSAQFIATGSAATLTFNTTYGYNNAGILLDAVDTERTTISELGTLALLGLGLAGVGFAQRSKLRPLRAPAQGSLRRGKARIRIR